MQTYARKIRIICGSRLRRNIRSSASVLRNIADCCFAISFARIFSIKLVEIPFNFGLLQDAAAAEPGAGAESAAGARSVADVRPEDDFDAASDSSVVFNAVASKAASTFKVNFLNQKNRTRS